jgi:hypothetical protein
MINNRLIDLLCKNFSDNRAIIFWLSYFKTKSAVSADEFFLALSEVAAISGGKFDSAGAIGKMVESGFCVSSYNEQAVVENLNAALGSIDIFNN